MRVEVKVQKGVVKFEDLNLQPRGDRMGVQAIIEYPNTYGASVIQGPYTYGGPEGFYEAAVFHKGHLCYDTPVTPDVEGWLTPEAVTTFLTAVAALPKRRGKCKNCDPRLSLRRMKAAAKTLKKLGSRVSGRRRTSSR